MYVASEQLSAKTNRQQSTGTVTPHPPEPVKYQNSSEGPRLETHREQPVEELERGDMSFYHYLHLLYRTMFSYLLAAINLVQMYIIKALFLNYH